MDIPELTGSITTFLNNGSVLEDPLGATTRGDDTFAFDDEIRWTGKFPKIFVEYVSDAPYDKSFGNNYTYANVATYNIYFMTKISNRDVWGDATGSYRNDAFVRVYQEKIREAFRQCGSGLYNMGISSVGGLSNIETPQDQPGFRYASVQMAFGYRRC